LYTFKSTVTIVLHVCENKVSAKVMDCAYNVLYSDGVSGTVIISY